MRYSKWLRQRQDGIVGGHTFCRVAVAGNNDGMRLATVRWGGFWTAAAALTLTGVECVGYGVAPWLSRACLDVNEYLHKFI